MCASFFALHARPPFPSTNPLAHKYPPTLGHSCRRNERPLPALCSTLLLPPSVICLPQGPPAPSTLSHHEHPHPHHRQMSSADGLAWNQLLQQADAANHGQGQGQGANSGAVTGGDGGLEPAGGRMMSTFHPSTFQSAAIGGGRMETETAATTQRQEQEQQQQSSGSMPPPASVLSSCEAHHAGGGGSGIDSGDGSSGSTMPSLRDLLFDTGNSSKCRPSLPPLLPPVNEMSMVESST